MPGTGKMSDITILPRECRATVLRDGETYTFTHKIVPRGLLRLLWRKTSVCPWIRITNVGGILKVDYGKYQEKD
jgi:hypothetical protein